MADVAFWGSLHGAKAHQSSWKMSFPDVSFASSSCLYTAWRFSTKRSSICMTQFHARINPMSNEPLDTHNGNTLVGRKENGPTRYLSRPVACSISRVTSPDANVLLPVWRPLCATLPRLGEPSAGTCRHMRSCWWSHSCLQEALGTEGAPNILPGELQYPQELFTKVTAFAAVLWL